MKHASYLPDPDTLSPPDQEKLRAAILKGIGPLRLPWFTHQPHPKQEAFLRIRAKQKFYGGAAGGGKSFTLMLGASQWVDVPNYAALLLRRTYSELALSGGLIDNGHELFGGTAARWNQTDKKWTFPSGASITFGYLQHEADKYRYKSSAFQYIAFDELTHFSLTQYTYMFSRLRGPASGPLSRVPTTICSASNPGGPGHDWVKGKFVRKSTRDGDAIYLPAKLKDNPSLDQDEYTANLQHLPSIEIDRLLDGDWDAQDEGHRFWASWFLPVDQVEKPIVRLMRSWDIAASEPSSAYPEPDWTVGTLMARHPDNTATIIDVVRARVGPAKLEALLEATARTDGHACAIRIEQEPGASGKLWAYDIARRALAGYEVIIGLPVGSKDVRARPFASAAERGLVFIVRAPWNQSFTNELQRFDPRLKGQVDDQVDSSASAYAELFRNKPATITIPRGTIG